MVRARLCVGLLFSVKIREKKEREEEIRSRVEKGGRLFLH